MGKAKYEKAVAVATDLIEEQGQLDADPLLFKLRGECKFILGNYNEAILDLSKIINNLGANPKDHMSAYSLRGQCNLILGNIDDALNDATKSKNSTLLKAVKSCKFQIEAAQVSEKNKVAKEALEHYQKALRFAPLSINHLVKAADNALQIGDSEQFDSLSKQIYKVDANYPGYLLLIGLDSFEKDELKIAEARFKKCSSTNNKCMRLLKTTKRLLDNRNKASSLIRQAKFDEAVEHMNACIEITKQYAKPSSPVSLAIDILNVKILIKKGNQNEALDILNNLIKSYPNNTELRCDRGDILILLEDYDGAVVDFSTVTRLDKNNKRAQDGLKKASELREKERHTDYYELLGVKKGCTDSELKSAFRKAIFKWHPDRFSDKTEKKNAEKKMKLINKAMDVLSDPQKRKLYDNGVDPENPNMPPPGSENQQQYYQQGGPQGGFFQGGGFPGGGQQFFQQFFQGGFPGGGFPGGGGGQPFFQGGFGGQGQQQGGQRRNGGQRQQQGGRRRNGGQGW